MSFQVFCFEDRVGNTADCTRAPRPLSWVISHAHSQAMQARTSTQVRTDSNIKGFPKDTGSRQPWHHAEEGGGR